MEGGPMSSVLGPPVQLAYATHDVDEAARRWTSLGAGPFFVIDHVQLSSVVSGGRPATFDHSSAYGAWGALMVELVVVHEAGPPELSAVVDRHGPGLHHVAHFVTDLAAAQAQLAARGWPEVLHATTSGIAFAFHDARSELGHLVEIYERAPGLVSFYERVAAAALGWDGSNPIRRR